MNRHFTTYAPLPPLGAKVEIAAAQSPEPEWAPHPTQPGYMRRIGVNGKPEVLQPSSPDMPAVTKQERYREPRYVPEGGFVWHGADGKDEAVVYVDARGDADVVVESGRVSSDDVAAAFDRAFDRVGVERASACRRDAIEAFRADRVPPEYWPEYIKALDALAPKPARKADADGWIPWAGGKNPAPGRMCQVELRTCPGHRAGPALCSEAWEWAKEDGIIAYRLA